jgi:hypothetical protein
MDEYDPDEAFEMVLEHLAADLQSFRGTPTPEAEEDARRTFEGVIRSVRPSEPLIRIEVIGGVPIAYRGFEELGPVRIVGGRAS